MSRNGILANPNDRSAIETPEPERLAAYERGWWIMAGLTMLGLIPMLLLIRPKPAAVVVTAPAPAHMREALAACGWKEETLAAE